MKSKTSFFNKTIYKKNLSRFFFFPVLYFLALFVGTSCNAILDRLELLKYKDIYVQTLQDNSDLHDAIVLFIVANLLLQRNKVRITFTLPFFKKRIIFK